MKNSLSIVIGCPHPLKAQGVTGIAREGGHTVSQVASDENELLEAVSRHGPDVVVIDGCLCGEDMEVVQSLAHENRIVVVLAGTERDSVFLRQALLAGARGCLCCDDSAERFLHSLELLALGTMVISSEHSERLTERTRPMEPVTGLTKREQQIAAMIARGATNQEIADDLFLSSHTVKIHVRNMLDKLNLRNRQQLAAHIAREGLVEGWSVDESPV